MYKITILPLSKNYGYYILPPYKNCHQNLYFLDTEEVWMVFPHECLSFPSGFFNGVIPSQNLDHQNSLIP